MLIQLSRPPVRHCTLTGEVFLRAHREKALVRMLSKLRPNMPRFVSLTTGDAIVVEQRRGQFWIPITTVRLDVHIRPNTEAAFAAARSVVFHGALGFVGVADQSAAEGLELGNVAMGIASEGHAVVVDSVFAVPVGSAPRVRACREGGTEEA